MSTAAKRSAPTPTTDRITVYAPATVAHLGVGFDIVGLALDSPGDKVTVEPCSQPGVELVAITGDGGQLPLDPERNRACIAAHETLLALGARGGVRLWLDKGLPLSSGLGSRVMPRSYRRVIGSSRTAPLVGAADVSACGIGRATAPPAPASCFHEPLAVPG